MKKIIILVFMIALIAIMACGASAFAGIITCYAAETFSSGGVSWINFSTDTVTNVTNCEIYVQSASTANSTWDFIGNSTNSFNSSMYNGSGLIGNPNGSIIMTTGAIPEDAVDYQLRGRCANATNITDYSGYCTTLSSRLVDFTEPTRPSSLSPTTETTNTDGSVSFSAAVTGSETTSCTLNLEGTIFEMAHSGDTCTLSETGLTAGSYGWTVIASDGTNNTESAMNTLLVDLGQGSAASGIAAINRRTTTIGGIKIKDAVSKASVDRARTRFQKEITGKELTRTGIGAVIGGLVGIAGGPLAPITVPAGAGIGGFIGMWFFNTE